MTNKQRLGDAPIEPEYLEKMNILAAAIDELFNGAAAQPRARGHGLERKVGFILMVFPFDNHEGRCNYISNGADRRDVVTLMKEQIKRFEGQPDLKGHA